MYDITGTWYLKVWTPAVPTPLAPAALVFSGPSAGRFFARAEPSAPGAPGHVLDVVQLVWDDAAASGSLAFRWTSNGQTTWYSGRIVEGVLVGRFTPPLPQSRGVVLPVDWPQFTNHVTGWHADYLDRGRPLDRVFDLQLYAGAADSRETTRLALLRLDGPAAAPVGRLKIYAQPTIGLHGSPSDGMLGRWPGTLAHQEIEHDVEVTAWDGTHVTFVRRDPLHAAPAWTETYEGTVGGRTIAGTCRISGGDPAAQFHPIRWSGLRAQVCGYGLDVMSEPDRLAWQQRTRRRLAHLLMAGNPDPIGNPVIAQRPPTWEPPAQPHGHWRDDGAAGPPDYVMSDVTIAYQLSDPYGGPPIARTSHAILAVPPATPPEGFKVVLAVDGHYGSARAALCQYDDSGDTNIYWYGDSFARRGDYVVLAVDTSHRDDAWLYDNGDYRYWSDGTPRNPAGTYAPHIGDDPGLGNGPHPSVVSSRFAAPPGPGPADSDWAEDGERAWDAIQAFRLLVAGRFQDPRAPTESLRVGAGCSVVVGHSLGGEVTAIIGALEPRLTVVIPSGAPNALSNFACFSHACGMWDHADPTEYVDASDYHALIAPRPLLLLTGARDETFLTGVDASIDPMPTPFSPDKEAARRSRVAYGAQANPFFVQFLHNDEHTFRVGATATPLAGDAGSPVGVQVPVIQGPPGLPGMPWQNDATTAVPRPGWTDLFACIADLCGEYALRYPDLTLDVRREDVDPCSRPAAGQTLRFRAHATGAAGLGPVRYSWSATVDGARVPVVEDGADEASVTVPDADAVTPPYELVLAVQATAVGYSASRTITVLIEDPSIERIARLLCGLEQMDFPPPPYWKDPAARIKDPAERYRYARAALEAVRTLALDLAKASGEVLELMAGPAPDVGPRGPIGREQATAAPVSTRARLTFWQRVAAWLRGQR